MWLTCQDALTFIFNSASFSAQFWMCPRGRCAGKPVPFDTALGEETGGASGWVTATQRSLQTKINKIVYIHVPDTEKGSKQPPFFPLSELRYWNAGFSPFLGGHVWALTGRELGGAVKPCCGATQIIKSGRKPCRAPWRKIKGGEKKGRKEVKIIRGVIFNTNVRV